MPPHQADDDRSSVAPSEGGPDWRAGSTAAPGSPHLLSQPAAAPDWRTSAALIAGAAATPRGGGLDALLVAVGEEEGGSGAGAGAAAPEPSPPPLEPEQHPAPRRHRPPAKARALLTRLADAGGGSGRTILQVAVGFALASAPAVLGPGWAPAFPAACTAPTYFLIAMLLMSPAPAVGVRLVNVAAMLGPAVVGSLAGGCAVSLAAALDPAAGPAFTVILALAAAPILAAAAVVRGASHAAPYVGSMGLILSLAPGSAMLGAASALAAARDAAASAASPRGGGPAAQPASILHQHWWLVVVPTLAAFGIAGGATVVASLLVPTLASTDVEAVTARALDGCGEALSHTAARLFAVAADPAGILARSASTGAPLPPAGAGAAALPPAPLVLLVSRSSGGGKGSDGGTPPSDPSPPLLMEREPNEAPAFEEWWARLCAPVDAPGGGGGGGGGGAGGPGAGGGLTGRLVSGFESVVRGRRGATTAAPAPTHHALGLADPGPPVASLRPLLGAARAALAAAACEPPILRGWGARPFCTHAWGRLLACLDSLVTALSALQAVAGDDTALSDTRELYPPALEAALKAALAAAAACLARLAARVAEEEEEEEGEEGWGNGKGGGGGGGKEGEDKEAPLSWAARSAGLRAAMADSVAGYVAKARSARPGHPVILPSAYTARSHAFAYVAAAAVVARVGDLDAAAEAALGGGECAGPETAAAPRTLPAAPAWAAWAVGLAHIALCVPVWVAVGRAGRAGLRKAVAAARAAAAAVTGGVRKAEAGAADHRPPAPPCHAPGPRPWRASVAAAKYFLIVWGALVVTLAGIAASPSLARLGPVAGFTAAALTASDKVEAAVSKVAVWMVATLVGGVVGGGVASIPALLTHPPALAAVLTALAAAAGAGARTGFRTATTLTLLTLTSISLCEAGAVAGAAACGSRGRGASPWCGAGGPGAPDPVPVWVAVAARTVSVVAGVLLAQAVCVLILPWYVSDYALASVGAAVRDGAEPFMEAQAALFVAGGRDAWLRAAAARGQQVGPGSADDDEETPLARPRPAYGLIEAMPHPLPPAGWHPLPLRDVRGRPLLPPTAADPASALQAAVAAPLVDVQSTLARDTTAWSRGVLATPTGVRTVLRSALSVLDALAALAFSLDPAIITIGREGGADGGEAGCGGGGAGGAGTPSCLTGNLYEAYVCATWGPVMAVFASLRRMVAALAAHCAVVHPHRAGWLAYCGPSRGGGGGGGGDDDGPSVTGGSARAARTRAALAAALADLSAARRASIGAQAAARRAYHAAMVTPGGEPAATFTSPADVVRHLAFMGALIKASNRLQGLAVAVLEA